MKISITDIQSIPSVLSPCLERTEVVLGGTIFKLLMGIFAWCNASSATKWSGEARLGAPRRKPPTPAWHGMVLVLDPSFTLSSDYYYRGLLAKVLLMKNVLPVLH